MVSQCKLFNFGRGVVVMNIGHGEPLPVPAKKGGEEGKKLDLQTLVRIKLSYTKPN